MCLPRLLKIDKIELSRRINDTMVYIPDTDFEPKYLTKKLASSEYEVNHIIMIKSVMVYVEFCEGHYNLAFQGFRWILQVIHELRKYSQLMNSHIVSSLHYERSLSLYALQSLILDPQAHVPKNPMAKVKNSRLDLVEGLLTNILECTFSYDMAYRSLNDQFMMSQLFFTFGGTYETMAILTGTLTPFQHGSDAPSYAVKPNKQHLGSMIRKYILAATLSLTGDDTTVVLSLQKVLTGLFLFGGVDIAHLHFFYEALKHFKMKSKSFDPDPKQMRCANVKLTMHCLELIRQVVTYWQKSNVKKSSSPLVLVMPSTDEVVLVESGSKKEPEKQEVHTYSLFMTSLKLKASNKTRFVDSKVDEGTNLESFEFVKFWEQCYIEHQGGVPDHLARLLNTL
ncbi:HHR203Cp [Eremothecium sinecaudum]|uniref:HHR203Cp n=1 Tax=Eremothecium sinecaudum TaxID=45286 RepID=A0A0X8HWT2_9SACH|nr:HHR203Cp [Eremothecium sinecaudum]AMD22972.1 HHR203Cp [Eremothecium sinecaudum]